MKLIPLSIMTATLLIGLSGCGSDKSTTSTPSQSNSPQTQTEPVSSSVNQPPIATFDKFTIQRGSRYDGQLTATDPDGDEVKYIIVEAPKHGSVVLHDNGCFTYTPDEGYQGTDTFSYRASDDLSSCAVKTVTVEVCKPTLQIPAAPTGLSIKALSTTALELTWEDNSDNEEGFVIYKDGKPICTTKANKTHKVISCGLKAGKSYTFEVRAKNRAGLSDPATAEGTTKDVTTPPAAPTELKAKAVEKTSVRLAWKDNADNESSYEIYQDGKKIKTISGGCTCTVIKGLEEGTTYHFVVKAVNKIGSGSSEELTVTTKSDAVVPVNHPPVALSDYIVLKSYRSTFALKGYDQDGDALTYKIVGYPGYGSIDKEGENEYYYSAYPFWQGEVDYLTYSVSDGKAESQPQKVYIFALKYPDNVTIHTGESFIPADPVLKNNKDNMVKITSVVWKEGNTTISVPKSDFSIGEHHLTRVVTFDNGFTVSQDMTLNVVDEQTTVAQAILGPVSNADFTISGLKSGDVIATGKTTQGDGSHIDTAGLIQVSQQTKAKLDGGLYLITVTGGADIDANDDSVWDSDATQNQGTLHAIMQADDIKSEAFKVNILTEIVYQALKDDLQEKSDAEIIDAITQKTQKLLKDAQNGGDVTGDGKVDGDDLVAWNPATDKPKLRVDYDTKIKPVVEAVYANADSKPQVDKIFNTSPVAIAQSVEARENMSKKSVELFEKVFYLNVYSHNVYMQNIVLTGIDADEDSLTYTIVTPPAHGTLSGTAPNLAYTPDKDYLGDDSFTFKVNDGKEDSEIAKVDIQVKGYRVKEEVYHGVAILDYIYHYNKKGLITNYTSKYLNSTPDYLTMYTIIYNSKNNILRKNEEVKGSAGNYILDGITTYTFDDDGNILSQSQDWTADGTPNRIIKYTYDDKGNVQTESYDNDVDGITDALYTYTYDDKGNMINMSYDGDGDGIADSITTFTYDNKGDVINKSFDYDADNIPDRIITYTNRYKYNGDGSIIVQIEIDDDGWHESFIKIYDKNKNLIETGFKGSQDFVIDDVLDGYTKYTWTKI